MAEFGFGNVTSGDVQPKKALNVHRTAGRGMTVRNTEWPAFGCGMRDRESFMAVLKPKAIGRGHV
ncbi:MAG: hypothetical protein ABI488_23495 [Polyangiaceae bacterium]